jgi:azurin
MKRVILGLALIAVPAVLLLSACGGDATAPTPHPWDLVPAATPYNYEDSTAVFSTVDESSLQTDTNGLTPTPTPKASGDKSTAFGSLEGSYGVEISLEPTADIGTDKVNLIFDKASLTASAGSEVVLEFSNNSSSFEHNWVLVEGGTKDAVAMDALRFPTGTIFSGDDDYIVPGDERIIAYTKLLDPGATDVIAFTAPVPGTYEFICTFPGHSTTMHGEFEVTP